MFAINILGVKEIIEYGNITPIPMMPSFIRGVINLRGAVVSVVDLNARFGNAPPASLAAAASSSSKEYTRMTRSMAIRT